MNKELYKQVGEYVDELAGRTYKKVELQERGQGLLFGEEIELVEDERELYKWMLMTDDEDVVKYVHARYKGIGKKTYAVLADKLGWSDVKVWYVRRRFITEVNEYLLENGYGYRIGEVKKGKTKRKAEESKQNIEEVKVRKEEKIREEKVRKQREDEQRRKEYKKRLEEEKFKRMREELEKEKEEMQRELDRMEEEVKKAERVAERQAKKKKPSQEDKLEAERKRLAELQIKRKEKNEKHLREVNRKASGKVPTPNIVGGSIKFGSR